MPILNPDGTVVPAPTVSSAGTPVLPNPIQKVTAGGPAAGQSAKQYVGKRIPLNTAAAVPAAPTAVVGAAGALTGAYIYAVTFVTPSGETTTGAPSAVVNPAAQQVNLSVIPTGPSGTTQRKIYRTAAGGAAGTAKFLATLNDNTTTVYVDNALDGTLGAALPTTNLAGGTVVTLETVAAGKNLLVTDIFLSHNTAAVLEIGIQAAGVDIFSAPVKGDTAPVTLPGIETQPIAAGLQQVNVVYQPVAGATLGYFLVTGVES